MHTVRDSPGGSRIEASFSPKHRKGSDRHRSPARRSLDLHSPQSSPYKLPGSSQDSSLMSTGEFVFPNTVDPPPVKTITTSISRVSNTAVTSESADEMTAPLQEARRIVSSLPDSKQHEEASQYPPPISSLVQVAPLPPVPNKLVLSRSTERIYEILNQHDSEKGKMQEDQIEPLSSTPAGKTGRAGSDYMFSVDQRNNSYESVFSTTSLPEGTFQGNARHSDGSLLAIIFQVRTFSLVCWLVLRTTTLCSLFYAVAEVCSPC